MLGELLVISSIQGVMRIMLRFLLELQSLGGWPGYYGLCIEVIVLLMVGLDLLLDFLVLKNFLDLRGRCIWRELDFAGKNIIF